MTLAMSGSTQPFVSLFRPTKYFGKNIFGEKTHFVHVNFWSAQFPLKFFLFNINKASANPTGHITMCNNS